MFKTVLVANRGEIGVRIVQACQELGIHTVALFDKADRNSLHVRLADECVRLESPAGFMDQDLILRIARERGADAIHPGYGFLAEEPDFIRACDAAGIKFIGPPAAIVDAMRGKLGALERVREAGIPTVQTSPLPFGEDELAALQAAASELGYPLVIKSCRGGRGPAEQWVRSPDDLPGAVRRAQAEAQTVYGNRDIYLEKAIFPAHQVGVQVIGDSRGHIIHLGDREGSVLQGVKKIVEESPAPCLKPGQREQLLEAALKIARLFNYQNLGTVEFLVDQAGQFYFTEIKARIQIEHPLTEMLARVDLVQEQIRLTAGEPLSLRQKEVQLKGWAMMCRINAEDPWNHFLPSPGMLRRVRLPTGPEVRVDTYLYCDCYVPADYNPLIAKLTVWAHNREQCLERMRRAVADFALIGTATNMPLIQRVLASPEFLQGVYTTNLLDHTFLEERADLETHLRDLAVAAAVLYMRRNQHFDPTTPDRLTSGWHRDSRRLPQ